MNGQDKKEERTIGEDEIEIIYDDDIDDDYMDEFFSEEGGEADDEEDDEDVAFEAGPGMDGFSGIRPQFALQGHDEQPVYCVGLDGSGGRLVTGGGDDTANVWNESSINTQSPSFKCRSHKDSVVNTGFSHDSTYFFTADLGGTINVWKTDNNELILSFEIGDISWAFWHFGSTVLFAGAVDGSIYMWKIPSGDVKVLTGSTSKAECGVLLPDGKRLAVAYSDGSLKIFDLKGGVVQNVIVKGSGSRASPISLDVHSTLDLIATGTTNGKLNIYGISNGKLLKSIKISEEGSVESVVFSPDGSFLACGSVGGQILFFDAASMGERGRVVVGSGVTKLIWSSLNIYAACLDGTVREIDGRQCQVTRTFGRHRAEVLDLTLSKDGSKIVSSSEDGSTFVFNCGSE